jgi:ATP-dependent helicase/nuclease subunit A
VLDESQTEEMIAQATANVLADAAGGDKPELADALAVVSIDAAGDALTAALGSAIRAKSFLEAPGGLEAALARVAEALGLKPGETADGVTRRILEDGIGPHEWLSLAERLRTGKATDDKRAASLAEAFAATSPEERLVLYKQVFLTDKDEPRAASHIVTKAVDPALKDRLLDEQTRILALLDRLRAARAAERTAALFTLAHEINRRVEQHKARLGALDFADLIHKTLDLLSRGDGAWVLYKLDRGIDHVLIDEAQDTNPEQWEILRLITADFTAGFGAGAPRNRTLFAVGDPKQSIYGFQGAAPQEFETSRRRWMDLTRAAALRFEDVRLTVSFRSARAVLSAVDATFAVPQHFKGLSFEDAATGTVHESARPEAPGLVELWPVEKPVAEEEPEAWVLPLDEPERSSPPVVVARRIAQAVKCWTTEGDEGGRIWRPGDVLVLVRKRGAAFEAVIRALKVAGVPVAGADRLNIGDHIAVLDLVAAGRAALLPDDDLTLATALKSPLVGFTDEDLIRIAAYRGEDESLVSALRRHADTGDAAARRGLEALETWRRLAADKGPFAFFATLLGPMGGRSQLVSRLGSEAGDAIDAFLCFAHNAESAEAPSLTGFLSAFESAAHTIKRDLDAVRDEVRVMTVHGAKGLEAPIVILADAANKPQGTQTSRAVYVVDSPAPMLIHAAGSSQHAAETLELRNGIEANLLKEYWRKLYVAMTRAEDELYVTGPLTPGRDAAKQLENTWYAAIEQALRDDAESLVDAEGKLTALIYPRLREAPQPVQKLAELVPLSALPLHLDKLAPRIEPVIVTPSTVSAERARPPAQHALDSLADQVRSADAARQEGIALHALLQHLGKIDPALWAKVVPKALEALLPALPERHGPIGAKAISILTRPELNTLFGPHSRAEVPFLVEALRDGEVIRITGRLDRLIIDDSGITLVDYKSDAAVPESPDAVPASYLTQLGLYALVATQLFPGQPVRAAILWTQLESLMNLPPDSLAAATSGFTLR